MRGICTQPGTCVLFLYPSLFIWIFFFSFSRLHYCYSNFIPRPSSPFSFYVLPFPLVNSLGEASAADALGRGQEIVRPVNVLAAEAPEPSRATSLEPRSWGSRLARYLERLRLQLGLLLVLRTSPRSTAGLALAVAGVAPSQGTARRFTLPSTRGMAAP